MRATKTKRVPKKSVTMPGEPDGSRIVDGSETYQLELVKALNWFNLERDSKDAKQYLIDYTKENLKVSLDAVKSSTDRELRNLYGWLARLTTTGAKLSYEHKRQLKDYIEELGQKKQAIKSLTSAAKKAPVTATKANVQDAIKEKSKEILGELEGVVDAALKEPGYEFSLFNELRGKEIGQVYIPFIVDWTKAKMGEYLEVYKAKDKALNEGYSNISKKQLTLFLKMMKQFIEDCDKYTQHKKANRKPRVKKEKPAGVQVKALKYMLESPEYKLKSINPTEVVGAQQLWVFNTKTRKLGVYRTDSTKGLQVRGTSIQNYDPDMSLQKTLRKPEDYLTRAREGGKIVLRKLMDEINSKPSPMNGRINQDVILLRAL